MLRVALALLAVLLPMAGCVDALLEDEGTFPVDGDESVNDELPTNATPIVRPTPTTSTPPPTPTTMPTPASPPPAGPTPSTPPPPPPASTTPPSPTPTPPPPPPTPTPTPTPTAWPRDGSFVTIAIEGRQSFSGTDQGWTQTARATWTYRDGDWHGACEGTRTSRDAEGQTTTTTFSHAFTASDPPHWPLFNTKTPPVLGEDVDTSFMSGCAIEQEAYTYRGPDTEPATVSGAPRVARTHVATSDEGDIPYDFRTEWSQTTGLVLTWSKVRGYGTQAPWSTSGRLVDTDAPL